MPWINKHELAALQAKEKDAKWWRQHSDDQQSRNRSTIIGLLRIFGVRDNYPEFRYTYPFDFAESNAGEVYAMIEEDVRKILEAEKADEARTRLTPGNESEESTNG